MPPPGAGFDAIQKIRKDHDKAYERWPPHINLLYPFLPAERLDASVAALTAAASTIAPFTLRFSNFDSFPHGTVWCRPDVVGGGDSCTQLQAALEREFPFCNELSTMSADGFHPHLTVGQYGKNELQRRRAMQKLQAEWTAFEFPVTHIHLLSRSGEDPFVVRASIPLSGSPTASAAAVAASSTPASAATGAAAAASAAQSNNECGPTPAAAAKRYIPKTKIGIVRPSDAQHSSAAAPSPAPSAIAQVAGPPPPSSLPPESYLYYPIIVRVVAWLSKRRDTLPKSLASLRSALKDMSYLLINVDSSIFFTLLPPLRVLPHEPPATAKPAKKQPPKKTRTFYFNAASYPATLSDFSVIKIPTRYAPPPPPPQADSTLSTPPPPTAANNVYLQACAIAYARVHQFLAACSQPPSPPSAPPASPLSSAAALAPPNAPAAARAPTYPKSHEKMIEVMKQLCRVKLPVDDQLIVDEIFRRGILRDKPDFSGYIFVEPTPTSDEPVSAAPVLPSPAVASAAAAAATDMLLPTPAPSQQLASSAVTAVLVAPSAAAVLPPPTRTCGECGVLAGHLLRCSLWTSA